MAQFDLLGPLVKILVNRSGFGKASVWHAVIVTFLHFFSWGLLTVPFIDKISGYFGNQALLVDGLVYGGRGLLGFVSTPVMGAISDFRGRKVVMLLAVVGNYLPIPFMLMEGWLFFVILTVSTISGAPYSACLAYVADVTNVENRSKGYGYVAASFGAGIAFSPFLGNYLMKSFGSGSVILIAAITGIINILFLIFGVPESLVLKETTLMLDKKHLKEDWNKRMEEVDAQNSAINPKEKKQILEVQKEGPAECLNEKSESVHQEIILNPNKIEEQQKESEGTTNGNTTLKPSDLWAVLRKSSKDKNLLVIYLITFLSCLPFAGIDATAPVYLKTNMGFQYEEMSMMLGLLSIIAISSNILMGYIMNLVGARLLIRLGLLFLLSQLLFFGFGTQHWMFWMSSILAAMATIIPAAYNAVASIYASPENQGAVLGIISGIECLSEGIGPALFGVLFYIFQEDSKDTFTVISPIPMPFFISGIGVAVAIILTALISKQTLETESNEEVTRL
ncbi:hippocampus abundant transcript 1 protein [Drosophila eugracilis]|uniref:hippocampus abundant transcript 1 protein n=1 Tax=Drosophila eugracilis TaxID=29029 RepID=UPI0007E72D3F|nr:hippocampus abundant transcript 1 protein [Drosophila eugracilis]